MRIAVLFSGRGSNMEALLREKIADVNYVLALTDNPSASGVAIAEKFHVPCHVVAGNRSTREAEFQRLLHQERIDLVVLAGFMRVLSPEFVAKFHGRILNIHPSLLPDFKGLAPQKQALEAGVKKSGCTVHIVTEALDGGPILAQAVVDVLPTDTTETLSARILVEEHRLYPTIIAQYADYLRAHPDTDAGLLPVPFSAIKEECGIFACYAGVDTLPLTIFGLHALQHRGQEGVGIASLDGDQIYAHRTMGLVSDVFSKDKLDRIHLPGGQMIGHLRYSTSGGKAASNLQPFVIETRFGQIGLAHNGNISNADTLKRRLMEDGQIFFSDSDSEVILHLIAQSQKNSLKAAIIEACQQVTGAFSLLILSKEGIYAVRDKWGFRPLCLGMRGEQIGIASESTALEATDLEWQFDIEAGALVHISVDGKVTHTTYTETPPLVDQHFCSFEYIYFMRANSAFNRRYTARVRERIGIGLAIESPCEADYVVPVPESGIFAAIGYAQQSDIPFQFAILKSSYVGRTFIEPQQELRHFGVRLKLSIDRWHVRDKRIILVDDSIVRASTLPKIVNLLRQAGAREVHVRVASPMIKYPCFYGIDMPTRAELSAANHDLDALCSLVGADSLAFVSWTGLRRAIDAKTQDEIRTGQDVPSYLGTCMACFTGAYPAPLIDARMQNELAGSKAQFSMHESALLCAQTRRRE